MSQELTKNVIIALVTLFLVGYIYNDYQSRRVYEHQKIGHASMSDIKGNMSWVLDLVHHMRPENPAREVFITELKNHSMSMKFLKALQAEMAYPQKATLK